ncbi:MAG: thioesterase family protein [bacterium]
MSASARGPSLADPFEIGRGDRPGVYRARIPAGWSAPIFPNGGLVSGVALRAMALELDVPAHRLRSSTTVFVSKVAEGEVEIEVDVLRRGKRMSQVRASIHNPGSGEAGHHLIAAFGEHREGYELDFVDAPVADGPDRYSPPPDPPPGVPAFRPGFLDRLEMRRVKMFASWEKDWEGGVAEAIRWVRYRRPESLAGSGIEAFDLLAIADTMPPALGQYLGPGHRLFHAPSVDLSFQCFARSKSDWVLARSRMRWAEDGYASAEMHLWDESRRLIAYATQMMLLRFPDPSELG